MPISLKDIARLANVSEATASLALNGRGGVNAQTRQRVQQIASENGYLPNAMACRLSKSKSGTIGLVIPDLENPFFGKLARCIDAQVRGAGYNTVIGLSNEDPETEDSVLRYFISNRVEGILIAPADMLRADLSPIRQISENYGIPYVFATSYYPGLEAPVVMTDLESGSYSLVRYLLGLGHRNIYFIGGKREIVSTACRLNGYIRAFAEYGLVAGDERLCECERCNFYEAYYSTCGILKNDRRVNAIVTVNDVMALGVLKALNENHIKIPDDISVAGYDNLMFSSVSMIPITTVSQDVESISREAVNVLLKKISGTGRDESDTVLIRPELIIRQSTG
ncbi:MAG: LacI family DNA-binding transcriptional regulator, partial [Clostridia bacterium]|nr:LacI family DNA-binding transcriptional regulator [Clostridia bacterium]